MKSPRYTLSEQAQQDIENIVEYIFADNPKAALEMETDIYQAFELLIDNPRIGHVRKDLTDKPYRFWTFRKPYLVIYSDVSPLRILRVMSGFRDIAASFTD
jgi:plasmid stabilization system protein ParE